MHIPNGFLSDPVCAITTAASAAACGAGIWRVRRTFVGRDCESLAAAGAAIFAAQMINFPIDHGTSGHLLAAAATALVLGPWTATLAIGLVLAVQATLFGDGSLTTWGANLLAMGIVAPWSAWAVSRLAACAAPSRTGNLLGAAAGAWVSVVAAAGACSLLLAAAGRAPLADVLPAMLQAHFAVGLSEALLTVALVAAIGARSRLPLASASLGRLAARRTLSIAAVVTMVLAPWASAAPDGLESVARRLGFAVAAVPGLAGLAPDYVLPGVSLAPLAIGLAGLVGVMIVFVAGYLGSRATTFDFCQTAGRPPVINR
jgi:cobalt/nickel transport system permease protein